MHEHTKIICAKEVYSELIIQLTIHSVYEYNPRPPHALYIFKALDPPQICVLSPAQAIVQAELIGVRDGNVFPQ